MDAMVWHPASFCLDTIKSESVIQMPVHILLNQKQQILYDFKKKSYPSVPLLLLNLILPDPK